MDGPRARDCLTGDLKGARAADAGGKGGGVASTVVSRSAAEPSSLQSSVAALLRLFLFLGAVPRFLRVSLTSKGFCSR